MILLEGYGRIEFHSDIMIPLLLHFVQGANDGGALPEDLFGPSESLKSTCFAPFSVSHGIHQFSIYFPSTENSRI